MVYWRRTRAAGLEAIEAWSTPARSTHAGERSFVSDERKQAAAGLAASADLREEDGGGWAELWARSGSATAGSGQEGPWLEEEVDPAGSEAGKGADGVGGEHGDGANATRSGGVKRGSGCISSL